MAENVVEILVKSRDKTKAGFAEAEASAETMGARVQAIWAKHSDAISEKLKNVGSGVGKGGGLLAIGSAALAMAGPLGAATAALGAFAAVAAPAFTKPGKPVKDLQKSFTDLQKTMAPMVNQVITLGAKLLKDLLPALGPLAAAGGKIITAFLAPLDKFFQSKAFAQIIKQFADFGVQAGKLAGPVMAQLLKLLLQLFVQLMPSGVQILKVLLPLIVQLVADLAPVIVVLAKVVTGILNWLTQTKLLKPVLLGLIPVIMLLVGSTGIGAILIAVALLAAGIVELAKNWRKIWADIKQWGKDAWDFLTHGWGQWLIPGLTLIRKMVEFVRDHWRDAWNAIKAVGETFLNWYRNSLIGKIVSGIGDIVRWFGGLPGRIGSAVGNAGRLLLNWGSEVIRGLLRGMTNIIGTVWTFIKGIPGKILNFLGIHSPPDWAIDAGKHIMNGLGIGMSQAQRHLKIDTSQFDMANIGASVGGGVQRWAGLVRQALRMEGLPQSLVGMVLTQMQSESGGNPRAINLWDSNAKAGHPSKGLMQVIGPTFAAYHWPGTSWNIYDPLANIAAALNYAAHNRGFGSGPGQVGSGHGYAAGGPASGWAWVGEHGRELVRLPPGSHVYSNADSMAMGGGGQGPAQLVLQITGSSQSGFDQFLIRWFNEQQRTGQLKLVRSA